MVTTEATYKTSHPWLTFRLDLRPLHADTWMLLGEARSKIDHLAYALLTPEVAFEMQTLYLAKGVHATTAIEGNTLSEGEARAIVEGTHQAAPSQAYLVKEVENVVAACNAIKDHLIPGGSDELTLELIADYNRQILEGTELEEGVVPGKIRTYSVAVGRYRAAPAEECEFLLRELCDWLNGPDFRPPDEDHIVPYALIKAVIAHLYLAWIHPFGDGNGRTARLVELQVLMAAGFPMPAAHLLSNHYNDTREEYYRQLDSASRSGGEVIPFLSYAIRGFADALRVQLDRVWHQQYADRWEQHIYQTFGHTHTQARERQRRLVLELSKREGPVPRREIPRMTIELFEAYRGTERMLSRDLNTLVTMGLIRRVPKGYVPKQEVILGFQPVRRVPPPEAIAGPASF
jgi:Fic family protein